MSNTVRVSKIDSKTLDKLLKLGITVILVG
jgi:hypothetical protein